MMIDWVLVWVFNEGFVSFIYQIDDLNNHSQVEYLHIRTNDKIFQYPTYSLWIHF
jgi:hypothetical protein